MAFRGIDKDPLRNYKYFVSFPSSKGGNARAGFSKVSGIKEETEIVEYREGTDPGTPRKLFGQVKFDNLKLERGIGLDSEFVLWRRDIVNAVTRGRNLAQEGDTGGPGGGPRGPLLRRRLVTRLGDYHAERGQDGVWSWVAIEAWPAVWECSELAGNGNEVALEMIEIAHEGLEIATP